MPISIRSVWLTLIESCRLCKLPKHMLQFWNCCTLTPAQSWIYFFSSQKANNESNRKRNNHFETLLKKSMEKKKKVISFFRLKSMAQKRKVQENSCICSMKNVHNIFLKPVIDLDCHTGRKLNELFMSKEHDGFKWYGNTN